ncbi:MAG: Uncharacterized protein XD94_0281 [Mesotoga prima]|uniref:EF-hand domain-containing protein n=1 Tax=Mesotoga prima TaxID=1184387 RepID=A0A124FYQ1_9BACT|nr:MAG: Uncharacterized protein XD94_0281 [Mesotoga prima]
MKKALIFSMVLPIVLLFLASCISGYSSQEESTFRLPKQAEGLDLYIATGIDALEITLSGAHIDTKNIVQLQDILVIVSQNCGRTTIALSKFGEVDFAKPVIRIWTESVDKIIVSKHDVFRFPEMQVSFVIQEAASPVLVGDYNGDGQITLSDFASFAPSYGFSTGSAEYYAKYDIGASEKQYLGIWQKIFSALGIPDGSITLTDFAVFANNYGFANPYLGTWTFTGAIDYDSSSFGQVEATGNGTATIESLNYNLIGNVTMSFEADYEDESGNPLHSAMTTTINNVSFNFDNLVMTIDATVEDPTGSGSTYDVQLRGSLRTDGNAVYAEVPSGDIYLLNPERKIGTWSGSKQ